MILKNVIVSGRRTSMRLEKEIWDALSESCRSKNITLSNLCSLLKKNKQEQGLSSAMRIYAFNFYRELLEQYKYTENADR